jgi:hypothetical protein
LYTFQNKKIPMRSKHLTDLFPFLWQRKNTPNFTPQMNPKPKKTDTIPRNRGATSDNKLWYVAFKVSISNLCSS